MTSRVAQTLHDLRLERHALRAEQARVSRWRRVVRARIDLAVAQAAPPGPLGEQVALSRTAGPRSAVPHPVELWTTLGAHPTEVGALPGLRDLDDRLRRYEDEVGRAIDRATSALVARVAADPMAPLRERASARPGT